MSNDSESNAPPDFGDDIDIKSDNDDSMFVSVASPTTMDVSIIDEDEDNPFGETTTREKTLTNTTNTVESSGDNEKTAVQPTKTDDFVEEEIKDAPEAEKAMGFSSAFDDSPFIPFVASQALSAPIKVEPPLQSERSNTPFETQKSSSKPVVTNVFTEIKTESKPEKKRSTVYNIEIVVSDPTKVGEVSLYIKIHRSRKSDSFCFY